MPSERDTINVNLCPELTEEEFTILKGILFQIYTNMLKLKDSSYAFSECVFAFDVDYGIYRAFNNLYMKFDRISPKEPGKSQ